MCTGLWYGEKDVKLYEYNHVNMANIILFLYTLLFKIYPMALWFVCVCVRVCVCACVCVYACARARVCVCVCV